MSLKYAPSSEPLHRQDAISLRAAAELPRARKAGGNEHSLDFGTVPPGNDGLGSLLEANERHRQDPGGSAETAAPPVPPPERIVALQNMSQVLRGSCFL